MTLKEYLKENGHTLTWFATQIPCSIAYLCIVVNRGRVPSMVIRKRIKDLTKGNVKEDEYGVKTYTPRTYKKRDLEEDRGEKTHKT